MKLKHIVGLEEMAIASIDNSRGEWSGFVDGYNSLASAEVVVDSRAIVKVINDMDLDRWDSDEALAQAIATAIESGSIISLAEIREKILTAIDRGTK